MHVTKRSLGVHYVAGTGLALSGLLIADVLLKTASSVPVWSLTGLVPALALGSALYWLPRTGLSGDQMWRVAQCSALGLELVTIILIAGTLLSTVVVDVGTSYVGIIASNVAMGAIAGVLVGAVWELRDTNRRMRVRTEVLNRVLRHNLRNDMTVVLGHLDNLKRTADESEQAEIELIQNKLNALVGLTEKVRQIDMALESGIETRQPVDVVGCIDQRLDDAEMTHPSVTIDADCPTEAWAYADDMLGTLLDNVIESAVIYGDGDPTLYVNVSTDDDWVKISIEDDSRALPAQDLAVVSAGEETKLNHGYGIEIWLVDWLVEKYGGKLSIEGTDGGGNVIDIQLPRARADSRLQI